MCYSQLQQKEPHCNTNTFNSKERSDRLLIVSDQQNPMAVCKYSSDQQNNIATTYKVQVTQGSTTIIKTGDILTTTLTLK